MGWKMSIQETPLLILISIIGVSNGKQRKLKIDLYILLNTKANIDILGFGGGVFFFIEFHPPDY